MKSFIFASLMSLTPLFAWADSYSRLWQQVEKYESDGLPKSAYDITQKILKKAERGGDRGQALSARLKSAALHQEWAPDSFFTDIKELEELRSAEKAPEAQAVYASVLAWLYESNRDRAQSHDLKMSSGDMREWTTEEYDSAAVDNWRRSMANPEVLVRARTKDWLPFIKQNKQSEYYRHDLLHVLWERFRQQRNDIWSGTRPNKADMARSIIEVYKAAGNREAALLVTLQWIDLQYGQSDAKLLRQAITEYGDLPVCAEAYLALANELLYSEAAEKVALCRECISRYPRYERIDAVRNKLSELLQPEVSWHGEHIYYPGRTYEWTVKSKNAQHLTLATYRMPASFHEPSLKANTINETIAWVRTHGELVETIEQNLATTEPTQELNDTIRWEAYRPGTYVVVLTATATEPEARHTKVENYNVFRCTRLQTIHQNGFGAERTIVVDAMSGQPVQGAKVEFYSTESNSKRKVHATLTTDAEGRATLPHDKLKYTERLYLYTHVTLADDIWLPDETSYIGRGYGYHSSDIDTRIRLYTDRAIYRPGQTVHVGGLLYQQQHWEAETAAADTKVTLTLLDVNWKQVGECTVKTDEMGKISADFVLPAHGLPGAYHLRCTEPSASIEIRVEEYKRPTFEVSMDEAPDLSWPADSITLTGRAMGYNGVPVREARVTGNYRFTYPSWWWGYHRDDSPRVDIDTVESDSDGRFSVRVPLCNLPEESLRRGLTLELNVDVLSQAGETHQSGISVPLSTQPLRLRLSVPSQQDRDRMEEIGITLVSSTGKPTDGSVEWTIYPAANGKRASEEVVRSGITTTEDKHITFPTQSLADLTSGQYELFVKATAGEATCEGKGYFIIFGMSDTKLPKPTEDWLYCPDDTFAPDKPARVMVGTCLQDVAFYYCIVAADSVMEEHLIRLDDEMRTLEIPYNADYGDGATLHTAFVKDGKSHLESQSMRLALPDKTLRWEWTSFRDRVHPGDSETWTLRITRPDGTPAPAQLMATIYDASLDALQSHYWSFYLRRAYNISHLDYAARSYFYSNGAYESLSFGTKQYSAPKMTFDTFDSKWLIGLDFMYRSRDYMLYDAAMPAPEPMMHNISAKASRSVEEAAEEEAAPQASEAETPAAPQQAGQADGVRTNFNETAAFMPRLMANAKGEVTLRFTLPESLTTWRLLGLAHTKDMMSATVSAETTARKELMARLYLPRFLRGGDKASIRATVQNLTEKQQNGQATLEIFDPETEQVILRRKTTFTVAANGESVMAFDYTPEELPTVVGVRLTAKADTFTDGEQHLLTILPSKTWVTESVEIRADSIGTFTTDLTSLFNSDSPTATNRRLTVEYTAHPIWHALQALPSLRQPAYDDVISLTTALTATGLSTHIAATTPRLRQLVEVWRKEQAAGGPALDSRLQQDEELKQIILDETPWLREAENDADRKARLIDLFDSDLAQQQLGTLSDKLRQRQSADGGFAWFPGMRSSEMMTRLVCIELVRLRTLTDNMSHLPSSVRDDVNAILRTAVGFIAHETAEDVKDMRKLEKKGEEVSTAYLMYLDYVYITQHAGVSLTKSQQSDVRYLLDHLKGSVASMSNNERAKAAIVLKGDGRDKEAAKYFASLLEHSTTTADHGTFFDTPSGSFVPTGNKIIVHTAAMEAARVMAPDDATLRKGLSRWLLQQKRTQMWESCICTSDAIYALVSASATDLASTAVDRITLTYPNSTMDITRAEADASIAGLGYIKQQISDGKAPRSITVERQTDSEAWGAVYASYLSPIADVAAASTGLNVRREMNTTTPNVGQRITIRYVITADRDYEYVHLSAERPACAEPASMRSGYEWRGGLGYYRAVHDTRTDYFFDSLPKGTYVLEEDAFIDREGTYTTGITTLRCLYAPEYNAHTTALTVTSEP